MVTETLTNVYRKRLFRENFSLRINNKQP